jgi:hypothetical protein
MTDKEFDKLLKGKLEDYQPEYDQNSWMSLDKRIENEVVRPESDPFDNAVRAALGQFAVSDSNGDWDKMEKRIAEDENTSFDHEVRENVSNFEVPYDATSWPVLDKKIAAEERFRRRLIGAKILEVAAILIAIFTFYSFFPQIKNSLFDKDQPVPTEEHLENTQFAEADNERSSDLMDNERSSDLDDNNQSDRSEADIQPSSFKSNMTSSDHPGEKSDVLDLKAFDVQASELDESVVISTTSPNLSEKSPVVLKQADGDILESNTLEGNTLEGDNLGSGYLLDGADVQSSSSLPTVEGIGLPNHMDAQLELGMPVVALSKKHGGIKFSFGASMDLNALYMPADQFYANGSHINFSEKHLLATGYSAGVGLLFGDGAWNFETGLYYSAKTYEPNRIIKIGKTFDVRTVDFSEISLHIVSVPMYAHWNFDRKGKTRFYAVMGAAVNIIATANYDLITRNDFRSGPSGGSQDRKTDVEVARIREHMLDGAEFSSKSYITVVGGFGVEHFLSEKMSVFAQPTYSYQVPFFQFSDQNGKQFQYVSMQLGTRVRLK